MSQPTLKRISCKRCQYRKLRCSRTEPCTSCTESSQVCEYRELDRKRRPASAEYVAGLENRIASLESFIKRIQAATPEERDSMLDTAQFGDHFPPNSVFTDGETSTGRNVSPRPQATLEPGPEGSLIYHGPTSIYYALLGRMSDRSVGSNLDQQHRSLSVTDYDSNFQSVAEHFGINMEDAQITSALMQFFKWQYPHFMFIYREAFLRDHFGDHQDCKYWSSALLLSVCALGLLMSNDSLQRQASEQFFVAAETILIVFGFTRPSIATVQAFLCLAFYEIGRGNLSKGWGFSGIAFRMAQDLGFQRDPKYWVSHDTSLATTEDIEIRRRIYWGCYTSDKLICLILGRPVYFSFDGGEVESLERLPDFPEMDALLPLGFSSQQGDFGEGNPLVPCFKNQIQLSRIMERMLSTIFSSRTNDSRSHQAQLDYLNLELSRWQESLPDCAKWNKWEPPSSTLIPSVAALHLLFHGARIALNFDSTVWDDQSAVQKSSREYCVSSAHDIISIIRKYRSQYGLRCAPFVLIYALAQAARCVTIFGTVEESHYLSRTLAECSTTWKIGQWNV
ncbi:fungal-specific transcription factor domain-containing protein [Ilyonectria sp. MPI-CAGE-AT-0026]|nr:fungal-specific transcription factor domain-containing protein [Ilyonectria sp. MPI-CAGE-AT-0026]